MAMTVNKDGFMRKAADLIQAEIDSDNLEHENREIHIPAEFDEKMLSAARKKDAERRARDRRKKLNKWFRVAAVFLICVISAGAFGMVTSEAFRKKVINVFPNESDGAVTLYNADEALMIGSWTEFWYPEVMPEGFVLTIAEETDHFLYYEHAKAGLELRLFEQSLDTAVTFDTSETQMEQFEVNYSEGYLFEVEGANRFCATWQTDDHVMMMFFDGQWEKADIMETIKGLTYIE